MGGFVYCRVEAARSCLEQARRGMLHKTESECIRKEPRLGAECAGVAALPSIFAPAGLVRIRESRNAGRGPRDVREFPGRRARRRMHAPPFQTR